MVAAPVLTSRDDEVAIVAIDRPARANTLDRRTLVALRDAIDAAGRGSEVRAVLLCSEGEHFCGGGDFQARAFDEPDEASRRAEIEVAYAVITALLECPKPTVCAVQGRSAGAGLALILACDLRIASRNASIGVEFVRFGLVPDVGLTWLLPTMLGVGRALDLSIGTDPIDADEALRWGVVSEVVEAAELRQRAVDRARRAGSMPAEAVREARRLIREAPGKPHRVALQDELDALDRRLTAHDTLALRESFFDGRRPR
jgi:2-(1,2-epoxy-1,2-dihydrophenyl)acetyl-CoA isomerase